MEEPSPVKPTKISRYKQWLSLSDFDKAPWGAGAALLIGVGLSMLIQFALILLSLPFESQISSIDIGQQLRALIITVAGILPFAAYVRYKGWSFRDVMLITKIKFDDIKVTLKGVPLYTLLTVSALMMLMLVAPQAFNYEQDVGVEVGDPISIMVTSFILIVLVVPVVEEILFRGILFRGFERLAGFWFGVVGSSLMFGLLHGSLVVATDTFMLGVVSCLLTARSSSLWPAILLHLLKNLLVYYARFIAPLV